MTTALKAAVTNTPAKRRQNTIAGLLTDPTIKSQIALALPKHMTAERLARIALTEVRKVPALAKCDQASFLAAIMQCAQLGLEPGGALGHAYLLPYENRKKGITEVQFIVGYRGMIDLARRSGQILSIEARAVYEADQFDVRLGLQSDLLHVPAWDAQDRGPLRFVYAVAKLKDGGTQFEVMSRVEVERVRAKSRAANNGPWVDHFEEMAKKTVIRRLFKYLPVSIELATAVALDEQAEDGRPQDNPLTFDVEPSETSHERGDTSGDDLPLPRLLELLEGASDAESLDYVRGLGAHLPEAERVQLAQESRKRLQAIEAAATAAQV